MPNRAREPTWKKISVLQVADRFSAVLDYVNMIKLASVLRTSST